MVAKKAPPTTGRGRPKGFHRGEEPPRIGTGAAAPSPLPTPTPMTPPHPPRPPVSALPQNPLASISGSVWWTSS